METLTFSIMGKLTLREEVRGFKLLSLKLQSLHSVVSKTTLI